MPVEVLTIVIARIEQSTLAQVLRATIIRHIQQYDANHCNPFSLWSLAQRYGPEFVFARRKFNDFMGSAYLSPDVIASPHTSGRTFDVSGGRGIGIQRHANLSSGIAVRSCW